MSSSLLTDICTQKKCGFWVGLGDPNPKESQANQELKVPYPTEKSTSFDRLTQISQKADNF
jgi:hypothetical protein